MTFASSLLDFMTVQAIRALRRDAAVFLFAVAAAVAAVFLIDTGDLATWVAENRQAKIDEIIVVGLVVACGAGTVGLRRWMRASYRLVRIERGQAVAGPSGLAPGPALHRDLVIAGLVGVAAVAAVALLDTGDLAQWVARQSHTRLDEAIVVGFALMLALSVFSLRRWVTLSRQLASAAAAQQSADARHREITILGELSDLLQSCRTAEEAQQLVANRAGVLFPGAAGMVGLINSSRNLVDVAVAWGAPALAERFFAPTDCWALRRGRAYVVESGQPVPCAHVGVPPPTRAICVPMAAQGETIGVLHLQDARAIAWSEDEQRLTRTLAEQAALALANLSLRETLRRQSVRDPLTGLHNRRYLEESLDRELQRAERRGIAVGVLMIDVDHFKRLNDTFGHDTGDAVLVALADLFRERFRGEDVVCRYGGEEFTVLLPETPLAAARERAEHVRAAASQIATRVRGQAIDRLTLSIGVAAYPEHGTNADVLLRAADDALYRAKQGGRDRVVTA